MNTTNLIPCNKAWNLYTSAMTTEPQKIYDFVYEGEGERLDIYLTRVQWYTRNFFHRLLGRGDITINGEVKQKKSYQLKPGDQIHIIHPERYMEAEVLAQAPAVPEVHILLEKEDYVVVHKPAGVLSHPNSVRGVEYPSVVWALYHHFKDMPSIGNFIRAWLIHRLDRETEWLMIIVKTEKWLKHFQKLFHEKSKATTMEEKENIPLRKCYRATSYILPKWKEFLHNTLHIGDIAASWKPPSPSHEYKDHNSDSTSANSLPYYISMIVEPKIPFYEPKLGITKIVTCSQVFWPLKKYVADSKNIDADISLLPEHIEKNYKQSWTIFSHKTRDATLEVAKKRHAVPYTDLEKYNLITLEMEILTWRTHQIRYHLSQMWLPIVGDYLYGWDDFYQMQLQAYKLSFEDPEGEYMSVEL